MQEVMALNPSLCKWFSFIQEKKKILHEKMWC